MTERGEEGGKRERQEAHLAVLDGLLAPLFRQRVELVGKRLQVVEIVVFNRPDQQHGAFLCIEFFQNLTQ